DAHGDRHAETRRADEADERRRIDCAHRPRTRYPTPAALDESPASIVERREAPWRFVDPRPAPRVLPQPVSGAIRRPIGRDAGRNPDIAVVRNLLPSAVGVEVLVADHVGSHVTRARRLLVARGAFVNPRVESVPTRERHRLVVAEIGSAE